MKLLAWRHTVNNPCDDPPVTITIAPAEKRKDVFPWVLPLDKAEAIFGKTDIDRIGTEAVAVSLTITPFNQEEP